MLELYNKAAAEVLEDKFGGPIVIKYSVQQELGFMFITNKGKKALSHEDMAEVHSKTYMEEI